MNAIELKKKILTGKLTLREKHNAKSPIWGIFREILNEAGEQVPHWVACHYCRNVYSYDNRKLGTSNLLKHKCGKGRVLPRSSIDLQDRILDGCLKFVTKDLRPFDVVSGAGFMDLAEAFVKAGSILKTHTDLAEIFPHQENFGPRLDFFAKRCREKLAAEMVEKVGVTGGGIVLETWKRGVDTYLSVSVHYVKNFAVVARVLSTIRLDPCLMETEDYLKVRTMQSGSFYGISEWLQSFVYVTPRGSFIQACLKNVRKINCASTPIVDALNFAITYNRSELTALKACRDVVAYFNGYGAREELKVPMVMDHEDRWDLTLSMFSSVVENISIVRRENLIDSTIERDVTDFMQCLKPFQQALSELNADKHPTIYLVYLWHFKILEHLENHSGDSQSISLFKATVKERYLEEVDIDIIHKVAVFLHPLLKNMRMVTSEREKSEIYQWVRSRTDEIKKVLGRDKVTERQRKPATEPTRLSEALIHFMDAETVSNQREEDELGIYQKMKLSEVVVNGFDLLDWWDRQKQQLPNLSVLANRVFAVPATSAHIYHCFSLPQRVLQERRQHLDSSNVDDVLFLNSHFKHAV